MGKKKILWMVVFLAASAGPLSYFGYLPMDLITGETADAAVASDGHGPAPEHAESFYLPIDPPFVVNFTHLGALRYLQISVELKYPDPKALDLVKTHTPAIRNALILLLSNQPYEKLSTLSGKEELRSEMVAAVDDIIFHDVESPPEGEIFITNFVMQ